MDYFLFTYVIDELNEQQVLTSEMADKIILRYFSHLEFLSGGRSLIRKIVPYFFNILPLIKLPKAFEAVNKVYPKLYASNRTVDMYFSIDIRKIILNRFGPESSEYKMSKDLVKLSYMDKKALVNESMIKVYTKNMNKVNISEDYIEKVFRSLLISENPFKRAVALLTCSGCRPIELFHRADFESDGENWVIQSGVGKSRDRDVEINKPILYISSARFIEEVLRLRADLSGKRMIDEFFQLDKYISKESNRVAKEAFSLVEDFTLYTTKKFYGINSYERYGKHPNKYGNNVDEKIWLELVYGHKQGTQPASFNYSNFILV